MFALFFCIAMIIAPIYVIGKAISNKGSSAPPKTPAPRKKDPADRHMDRNYADVDWLRNGKL